MNTTIHHVWAQIAPRSDRLPQGQVAEGFYTIEIEDGVRHLTMTDAHGVPVDIDGKGFTATLRPNEYPDPIAAKLTREIRLKVNPSADFNRPIRMTDLGLA
jgi:hypothetical protein